MVESKRNTPDIYGRIWPEGTEVCEKCCQPDSTGDCTCQPYTIQEALELGAWNVIPREE